jgi:hypothetical protein
MVSEEDKIEIINGQDILSDKNTEKLYQSFWSTVCDHWSTILYKGYDDT